MKINIFYATILGTSEMLAEDLEADLAAEYEITVSDILEIGIEDLNQDAFYVFVSSTTGVGDMPDSAIDFAAAIREAKPDLSNMNYAIFGLGDEGYGETYNMGSQQLSDLLKTFGAKQVGERGLFDASTGEEPEEIAIPWLRKILENF